jgi:hypothetical protein
MHTAIEHHVLLHVVGDHQHVGAAQSLRSGLPWCKVTRTLGNLRRSIVIGSGGTRHTYLFHVKSIVIIEGDDMAEEDDAAAAAVRSMIERFYKVGGVPVPPNLQINEGVAAVFATMLDQAMKCSKAMNFVPVPPMGIPSLKWLGSQARRAMIGALIPRLYTACVAQTIRVWGGKLQAASQGVSHRHFVLRWHE